MIKLADVWSQIELLLNDGISIIPVRDREEKGRPAKTPYPYWKKYQSECITKDELWHQMDEQYQTTAVAMVCGTVSGNLEVIDIDSKYCEGIDARVFASISELYPDLWSRLKIHKSPSGGYHIIYRVDIPGDTPMPGNQKLAARPAAPDELKRSPGQKTITFLETRGEGGYVLAPPSLGYSIHKDNAIPSITWEERNTLINLCKSYNQVIKTVAPYKATKVDNDYYDENPWEDFNRRCDPVALIQDFGWKVEGQNNIFTWFTRPGKDKGVSASFNHEKRVFYIFTSSVGDLEPERGYLPSTLLAQLKFAGDKKKTYQHLIGRGYGRVKPKVEAAVTKKKAMAGDPLPPNFSDEAKLKYAEEANRLKEQHPHGIFWQIDEEGKVSISRQSLYEVSGGLGFRVHESEVVCIDHPFVYKRTKREYFDALKAYIKEEDGDLYTDICDAYEAFIQRSGEFTISRLEQFDPSDIINDNIDSAFKFYDNCFIEIRKDTINRYEYDQIGDSLIWHHKVLQREWVDTRPEKETKYEEYLRLAVGDSQQLRKVIGYLAHDFKEENTGYIIVLTETVADPRKGGGSGKNIFGNLLRHTSTVCTVPGSQTQFNEKLLQAWNRERIFFMADMPKKVDWSFLKEVSTGSAVIKKLYKDEITIPATDTPKLLMNTNYSYEITDGGLARRVIPVEFTDYFTRCGGVDEHFGCLFPSGWTADDWAGFDHFISECLQEYFLGNGKIKPTELSYSGWLKQFIITYQEPTLQFIQDNIDNWLFRGFIPSKEFSDIYNQFVIDNGVSQRFKLGPQHLNRALEEYCKKHDIEFDPSRTKKVTGTPMKGRNFERKGTSPVDSQEEIDFSDTIDDDEVPF